MTSCVESTGHKLRATAGPSFGARDIAISVCIVATDVRHYIEDLIPTVYAGAQGLPIEVLLIDNASTDGVVELHGTRPALRVIRNTTRLGFSANHNIAIQAARGEYVLVLNPDVLCSHDTLRATYDFMEGHRQCGVCGCAVYHPEGDFAHPARRFQTLPIILARRFPLARGNNRVIRKYFYQDRDVRQSFQCDWLSGCFLFFRRAALDQIGLFDMRFRKYFEDVDICRRVWKAGWQVWYFGGTSIIHMEQRASKRLLSKDAWLHVRSYAQWLAKYRTSGLLGVR